YPLGGPCRCRAQGHMAALHTTQGNDRAPSGESEVRNGMPGGPDNPLGARALYLYQNGQDTLYRIHGTTEPMSIGKNASSGCIRMINQDAVELYQRAPVGSRVIVMVDGK